jgi:hypothetical protein
MILVGVFQQCPGAGGRRLSRCAPSQRRPSRYRHVPASFTGRRLCDFSAHLAHDAFSLSHSKDYLANMLRTKPKGDTRTAPYLQHTGPRRRAPAAVPGALSCRAHSLSRLTSMAPENVPRKLHVGAHALMIKFRFHYAHGREAQARAGRAGRLSCSSTCIKCSPLSGKSPIALFLYVFPVPASSHHARLRRYPSLPRRLWRRRADRARVVHRDVVLPGRVGRLVLHGDHDQQPRGAGRLHARPD